MSSSQSHCKDIPSDSSSESKVNKSSPKLVCVKNIEDNYSYLTIEDLDETPKTLLENSSNKQETKRIKNIDDVSSYLTLETLDKKSKSSSENSIETKKKKGRESVLKTNNFRHQSDLARFVRPVKDISLPSNKIQNITKVVQEYDELQTITRVVKKKKVDIIKKDEINHQDVSYNGKEYTVCYHCRDNKPTLFTISKEDKEKIIYGSIYMQHGWAYTTSGPAVHRVVMGEPPSEKYSVDHLNRIRRDNRRENLQFKTHTGQMQNQFIRDRTIELPEDCGIEHDDIPKHVTYRNEEGRGERFEIEINGFPHLPKNLLKKKTTCRRDVSLRVKLQEAIYYLRWLSEKFPELKSVIRVDKEVEEKRLQLTREYNDIIKLTSYPKEVIEANLVDFVYDTKKNYNIDNEEIVEEIIKLKESGKKKGNNLPENCGVKKSDIPKYCYYDEASLTRGDKFVIDRHPKLLEKGKRQLATPDSKVLTTKEKFDILLEYLHCLENDLPIVKKEYTKGKRGQFSKKDTDSNSTTSSSSSTIENKTPKKLPTEKKEKTIDLPEKTIETKYINEEFNCVPKYVYYKPSDGEHGSSWYIKGHPKLASRNIKVKTSRTSALLTDKEKYDEILEHFYALENDLPFKKFEVIRGVKNQIHKEKSNKKTPKDWDLEKYPICEYLYYQEEKGTKGDYWMIKRHPKQTKDMICSTTSKSKTTLEKYLEALEIIKKLDEL